MLIFWETEKVLLVIAGVHWLKATSSVLGSGAVETHESFLLCPDEQSSAASASLGNGDTGSLSSHTNTAALTAEENTEIPETGKETLQFTVWNSGPVLYLR